MIYEYWVEVNIFPKNNDKTDEIVKGAIQTILNKSGNLVMSWHFLYEPAIRFRIRVKNEKDRLYVKEIIEKTLSQHQFEDLIERFEFGSHGEFGKEYGGEQELYGERGWEVMQKFLEIGSEIKLSILEKGVEKPIDFYASRFLHCLLNQLGYHKDFSRVLWLDEALFYLSMGKSYMNATIDVGRDYLQEKGVLNDLLKSLEEMKKILNLALECRGKL